MGCFSPDAPPPVNYGQQTRDTLQAQVDLAPQLYQSEATYQPLYANLALANLQRILTGSPGGPAPVAGTPPTAAPAYPTPTGVVTPGTPTATAPAAPVWGGAHPNTGWAHGGNGMDHMQPGAITPPVGSATSMPAMPSAPGYPSTVTSPAQPGLFSLLQQQNTNQRVADINDVATLGGAARQAMLAANPDNAALLSKLNAQANTGLDAGSMLTDAEARAMQQQSRAAFAARGMGGSNAGVADELLKQFNLGQQLQTQRQQFAESVLGENQAVVGDPFQQILGRNSGAVPMGQGMQPGNIFNPESNLSSAITAGNQQMNAMFATSTAQQAGNAIAPINSAVASY